VICFVCGLDLADARDEQGWREIVVMLPYGILFREEMRHGMCDNAGKFIEGRSLVVFIPFLFSACCTLATTTEQGVLLHFYKVRCNLGVDKLYSGDDETTTTTTKSI